MSGQFKAEFSQTKPVSASVHPGALPGVPLHDAAVLANTGVTQDTVAQMRRVADGGIMGLSLKVGGDTWADTWADPWADPNRARDFLGRARAARS